VSGRLNAVCAIPFALTILLAACRAETPSTAPASISSPSPTHVATPTPEPTPRALRPDETDWARVPFEAGLRDPYGGGWANAVAAGPRRVVIVGQVATGAAAWFSGDGLSWQRATGPAAWRDASLSDVAVVGDGFLAVGGSSGPDGDTGGQAWASTDGETWRPVSSVPRASGGFGRLAVVDGTLFATGRDPGRVAVWSSADGGASWRERRVADAEADLLALGAGPDGGVIAAGAFFKAATGWHAGAFRSLDGGVTWTEADVGGAIGGAIADIVATREGLVAVGMVEHGAAAWTSTDGAAWELAPGGDGDVGAFDAAMRAAAVAADGRIVAAGIGPDGQLAAWWSDDGRAWARSSADGPSGDFAGLYDVTDVAFAAGRPLLVGSYPDGPRGVSAAVWSRPRGDVPPEPTPGVVACPGSAPDLVALIELSTADRLRCYAGSPVTVLAYLAPFPADDGDFVPPEPRWLAWYDAAVLALPIDRYRYAVLSLTVHVDPHSPLIGTVGVDQWAVLTGIFDHRAAADCPADLVEACRGEFVLTRVRFTPPP